MADEPRPDEPFHMEHVRRYQASDGEDGGVSSAGYPVLLITTTGRKSGQLRTNPVVYMPHEDTYVVVGSNAGRDKHSNWYLNLKENPEVTIQVKADVFTATAREAEGDERGRLWAAFTAYAPAFKAYETATEREMPVIVLEPR